MCKAGTQNVESGGGFRDGFQLVHNRVVLAGADVQNGRSGTGPVEGQFDGASHVGNVGEIPALAAVAVDDHRLARLDPAAESLQGKVGTLAWTPDGDEPQAVEAGVSRITAPLWK